MKLATLEVPSPSMLSVLVVETKRRINLAMNCFRKYSEELSHRPSASLEIKVRVFIAQELETML